MRSAAGASGGIDATFELIDQYGVVVSNRSFGDKLLLVFFGFTHCRAVCPRKLAELAHLLDDLVELAAEIQPLYITVDPERDVPDRMRAYLEAHPRFVGLTGTRAQIDDVKARFRVFAQRVDNATAPGGYDIPHTAVTYLVDRDGRHIAHFLDGVPLAEMASRIGNAIADHKQMRPAQES